jgi:hypothetical protein
VWNPEGNRPLGRPRRKWENNIKINHQELGCEVMDWTELAKDRDRCRVFVNAIMKLRVPCNAGNFMKSLKLVTF